MIYSPRSSFCALYLPDWVAAGYPTAASVASGRMNDPVTLGAAVRCVCLGEQASKELCFYLTGKLQA